MHHLTEFSLRRPWLTLLVLLAITVGLGAGVPGIQPGYGARILLGDQHPAVRDLDAMIEEYSGGSPARIAWECGPGHPCENVFDEASLQMADALTRELELLPVVRAVEGPTTAALLVPETGGFAVRHFMEGGALASDAKNLSERAASDRLWRNTFVSADGQVGVIVVQPTDNRPQTMLETVEAMDSVLEPFQTQGFHFYTTGDAQRSVISGKSLAESTGSLIPVLVTVVGIILFFCTRSWQQTAVALLTMGIALVWAQGFLGWLKWPRDGMLQVLAPLIMVIGVCDAMHLLARYASERRKQPKLSVAQALIQAAHDAGPACLITTLTTVAAFLSFTTSALDTFVRFGAIAAFAVAACLLLSFTLLPVLLQRLPADATRVERATASWNAVMDAVVRTTTKRATTLLAASAILFGFFGWGWTQLSVDQNWLDTVGDRSKSVRAERFMDNRLGLSQSLELDITLPDSTQLEDPATLAKIQAIADSLTEIPEITQSTSVLTLMERLNRLLHDDDPAYERTGDTTAANAELLEILSFDDPETLGRWLSLDRSRIRLSFDSVILSQKIRQQVLERVDDRLKAILPSNWNLALTGEFAVGHAWVRDVQATQLRSFPTAFAIVFVLVSVFLRSWKLGLAAMVPTLLPVVVILGLMGWAGLTLDVARAMIAAVVIGIGVDDAVHILAQYKARRDQGLDARAAMQGALRHTGRAVVTTSAALALGFLTLMMSAWQTIASFGFLVSIAILGALAASLFVLPALVFAFSPSPETPSPHRGPVPTPERLRGEEL